MASLSAVCGVLIVAFALITTRRTPTDAQLGIEVTSFVGGLLLCFIAVVLSRLGRVMRRLDALAAQDSTATGESPVVEEP